MSSIYNFKVRAGNSGTVENETGLELVLTSNGAPVNGDESALVYIQSNSFIGTLEFTGCNNDDGTQFFPSQLTPTVLVAQAERFRWLVSQ